MLSVFIVKRIFEIFKDTKAKLLFFDKCGWQCELCRCLATCQLCLCPTTFSAAY